MHGPVFLRCLDEAFFSGFVQLPSSRLISALSVVASRPDSALNLSFAFSAFAICSSASLRSLAASCLIEAAELPGRVLLAVVISCRRVVVLAAN